MKSILEQKMKEARINNSSDDFKKEYKTKSLEAVLEQLDNKENRYIFYCPDIAIVNPLVKLIYETAYEAQEAGYSVVILHEIDGFKCKWLLQDDNYKHLKALKTDYIIKAKSGKSKKTKSQYAFQPADTLIVPDQFQEMLENLAEIKILQKAVLVTSYTGLSSIQPGVDYQTLGVDKIIFTEQTLLKDYASLYQLNTALIDKYPINKNVFSLREEKEVLPIISISSIGNNDIAQMIINIFHNKYPNLRVFNFRILDRNSVDIYSETLKKSALLLNIDKVVGCSQSIYEALSIGCPVATTKRPELETEIAENTYFGDTPFEIADNLAFFCQTWLNNRTEIITAGVKGIKNFDEYNYENFKAQVVEVMEVLRENRIKFFSKVKESLNGIQTSGE
jgi:hypothetical protein